MGFYVVRNHNDQNKMLKVYFYRKSRKLPEHTQNEKEIEVSKQY